MALADDIQNRISTQLLTELTNPNDATATTVDTTILGYAISDVTGDFLSYGITLDSTDASHLAVAIDGVLFRLNSYKGIPANKLETRFYAGLDRIEQVGPRSHILPVTDSEVTPSDERPDSISEVRPAFDPDHFGGFAPRPPREIRSYRERIWGQ